MSDLDNEKLYQENLEIVDYLETSRLFGQMSKELLDRLEPLSEIVSFPSGTEILTEDQDNDRVYLLMRGEVEIYARGEHILSLKRQGDIFGEMSIISCKPCSATVISKTPVTLFTVNARNVGKYSDAAYGDIKNFFYRVFAMILTEKLTLTTAKAREYEKTSKLLEETKISLEQKIIEQKKAEENRLRLEAQLRHSQKLEAIGTLAGGIAHDFNNLLFTMLGYITMAKDELPEDSGARKDLEESLIAGKRAKELVQQILTFSRHQEGGKKPIQITPLIKETLKFIRSSLPRSIEIRENISDDHGIILGEPSQIHQVVMNLCTNAGYAMKENGGILSIELSEGYVNSQLSEQHDISVGDYLIMSVEDTGSGINEDIIGRVFDPFFTTKPVGEGSGMGLAVVHGIIRSYEGAITVCSTPGESTRFTIYLPIVPTSPQLEIPETSKPANGVERILLIDNKQTITGLMSRILTKTGYQTISVNTSEGALDELSRNQDQLDMVVLDEMMPKIKGLSLCRNIRNIAPDIKILLMVSDNSQSAETDQIKNTITKPFDLERLPWVVRETLDIAKNS